jgi:hypothetical protein
MVFGYHEIVGNLETSGVPDKIWGSVVLRSIKLYQSPCTYQGRPKTGQQQYRNHVDHHG